MSCPFLQQTHHASSETESKSACPYAGVSNTDRNAPLSCPLGFGSTSKQKLSPLHCTHCRSLLHDAVKVKACSHIFCKYCISKFRDCPLCGVDIDELIESADSNELVSKFLKVHAGNPSLWTQVVGTAGSNDTSRAGFFLQLGMQSFAGGNVEAALSRLQTCKQELLLEQQQQQQQPSSTAAAVPLDTAEGQVPGNPADSSSSGSGSDVKGTTAAAASSGSSSDTCTTTTTTTTTTATTTATSGGGSSGGSSLGLSCKLGAVCGSQADCCRHLGDLDRASALYQESVAYLEPHADSDPEVSHALSVSYNKQGDLHYMKGSPLQARQWYMRGLALRQRAVGTSGSMEGKVAQVMDLVVSVVKVADASKAVGDEAAVQKYAGQARQLLQQLEQQQGEMEGAMLAKHRQLVSVLDSEFAQ